MLSFGDLTTVEAKQIKVAILPVGAFEQHGPHLPLITDAFVADFVASELAKKIGVLKLPAIWFGCAEFNKGFPGTVWVSEDTLCKVVRDIAESLNLDKLIVINTHGGNECLNNLVSKKVLLIDFWDIVDSIFDFKDAVHADASETAVMLHIAPELVKMKLVVDEVPSEDPALIDSIGMAKLSKSGVWGKPSEASEQLGKEIILKTIPYILKMLNGKQ